MVSRSTNFRTGLALGAVLMLGIAIFLNRTAANVGLGRFDLTQDRLYTVSQGAKNILGELKVPVQVRYYVTPTDQLPAGLKTLRQDVADKLSELSIASKGKLDFKIVNPDESEELQKSLQDKGIRPFQVQSVERDAVAVKLVYSALSIGYKDEGEEVLPQILPDNLGTLEYELLSRVLKLVRDKQPVVALYTEKEGIDPQLASMYLQAGQQIPPPEDHFQPIAEYLRSQGYDVRPVEITRESPVPPDAQTLVLLGAKDLNERQRYEIARVLERGGAVIVAAQATSYDYNPGTRGGFQITVKPQPVGINDLTSFWGLRIDDRMLMDAQMATLAIPRSAIIGGIRFQTSEPVQAPMQIRVLGDGIRRDLPFTAGVPELLYLWGNQLVLDKDGLAAKGLTETTVFTASDKAWIVDKTAGTVAQEDLDAAGHTTLDKPPLCVLLEGDFPDPWAGKPVPNWPADTTAAAGPEAPAAADSTRGKGRLLVFGCSKLFEDMLIEQAGHASLLLNSVDALTLGDDLISIRSKTVDARTFGVVSDGKKLAFRVVNMALVPLLLVGFGLGGRFRRRREAEEYAERLAKAEGGSGR